MDNVHLIFIALVLYSAAGTILLALSTWQKRKAAGAAMLAILLLAISWWGLAYGLECLWPGIAGKIFWARMKYFGIVLVPPALLGFSISYSRSTPHQSFKRMFLFLIVPLFTLIAIWTDPWHNQFYTEISLNGQTRPPLLETTHGVFFWIHAAYSYLLLLIGSGFLVRGILHTTRLYRRQQWMILLAALFPWVANFLNIFALSPIREIDLTPVAFMISGAATYIAVFHFGLLEIAPIARRVVVDNMADGMLLLDPEARILDLNPALAGWLGIAASQAVGHSLYEIIPEEVALLLAEGEPTAENIEVAMPVGDQPRVFEVISSAIHDRSGDVSARVLLLRDVTERNRVEQSLWRANELLQRMYNNMDLLIVYLDQDFVILQVNRVFAAQVQMTREEIIGKNLFALFPNKRREKIFRQVMTSGEVYSAYAEPYNESAASEGYTTYWNWSLQPVRSSNGVVEGAVLSMVDVTQREQASRALAEALDLNQQMISASAVGILAFDRSGQCVLANEAGARISSHNQETLMQANFKSFPGWRLAGLLQAGEEVLASGQTRRGEFHLIAEDGREIWLECYLSTFASGGKPHLLLISHDVTDRKRIERSEREQRLLAETFRDTAAALNSAVQIDAVLNLVLNNIGRVVPHDAAHVMLFNENGEISRWRFSGYNSEEQHSLMKISHARVMRPGWSGAVQRRGVVIVADTLQTPSLPDDAVFHRLRAFLDVPIQFKERLIGVITLSSAEPGFFQETHGARLKVFADQAAVAVENARLYGEVQHLTLTDELTRMYNYRGLIELGQREFDRARRFRRPLSLLFFDVDHFRDFNNRFSHAVGNQVLQEVAQIAQGCMRAVDLIARYGGEEFVVLLPETGLKDATLLAERIRREVEITKVRTRYGVHQVTVSIGVAELTDAVPNLAALIEKANHAEHHAKQEGRNRVVTYPKDARRRYALPDPIDSWSI